jgi:hypothetical protein
MMVSDSLGPSRGDGCDVIQVLVHFVFSTPSFLSISCSSWWFCPEPCSTHDAAHELGMIPIGNDMAAWLWPGSSRTSMTM